jgi:hypothetical protein
MNRISGYLGGVDRRFRDNEHLDRMNENNNQVNPGNNAQNPQQPAAGVGYNLRRRGTFQITENEIMDHWFDDAQVVFSNDNYVIAIFTHFDRMFALKVCDIDNSQFFKRCSRRD